MTDEVKGKHTITTEQFEQMLKKARYKERYGRTLRSTIYALITVAAVAVLIAVLLLPVFQIYGHSMTPTLEDGDIVLSVKTGSVESQDIIAFYYNNKVLVKRVIAESGQWVDIDREGNVKVDGVLLDEPYLTDKARGECDIDMPYQVPEGKVFVMGDHRSVSADSRNLAIGCVSEEQIVGKLVMCVWPLENIGKLEK